LVDYRQLRHREKRNETTYQTAEKDKQEEGGKRSGRKEGTRLNFRTQQSVYQKQETTRTEKEKRNNDYPFPHQRIRQIQPIQSKSKDCACVFITIATRCAINNEDYDQGSTERVGGGK